MTTKNNTFSDAVLESLKSLNKKRSKLIRKKKIQTIDEKIIKGLKSFLESPFR